MARITTTVWPDGRIIFQYLAIYGNENLCNNINIMPKLFQNFAKCWINPLKIAKDCYFLPKWQKFAKNLVTMNFTCPPPAPTRFVFHFHLAILNHFRPFHSRTPFEKVKINLTLSLSRTLSLALVLSPALTFKMSKSVFPLINLETGCQYCKHILELHCVATLK